MGKSEILMLLAGVALSIMLAMIAIPMFSSGSEMADRQQVQQELMAINSAIPIIKGLEGDGPGTITAGNIENHMQGFKATGSVLEGKFEGSIEYTITDNKTIAAPTINTVTIAVAVTDEKVDLTKLSRLNDICNGGDDGSGNFVPPTVSKDALTCIIKR